MLKRLSGFLEQQHFQAETASFSETEQTQQPTISFKKRLPILIFVLAFQELYFPINQMLSGGTSVDIAWIDGKMPLLPIFVIPYALGLMLMPVLPTIAAFKFPQALFEEYMLAFFAIMVMGFSIWILFPAYVAKEPITHEGFFYDLVRMLHNGDSDYGTHNAVPSSHVYYITLAICYYIRYNPRFFWPGIAFAVINALSTMFTHQHYFIDVITGIFITAFIVELTTYVLLPAVRRWRKPESPAEMT